MREDVKVEREGYRLEHDSLGEVWVPADALFGAQTQRAVENFPVSGLRLPPEFIHAQGIIKFAAARVNMELGVLDDLRGRAIMSAAREVIEGVHDSQFVVDVYQAGAGTSQNMNANEVIANRANELLGGRRGEYRPVHPNDHVNMAQSTNDTIHVVTHIAAMQCITRELLPALESLERALGEKAGEFHRVVKSGRTHLMDAVPIRMGQEFSGYAAMVGKNLGRIRRATVNLREINIGATAVGTGTNAHPEYHRRMVREIGRLTGISFTSPENMFEATANMDACVEMSGALRSLAVGLTKLAGDLRLMGSGPRTGLAELNLPPVQPGSSIMPGKVNPVMAEMLNMVCYQVMGNDATIASAGSVGQFELNVMMPVIAYNLLHSIKILSGGITAFTKRCIRGLTANEERCRRYFENSLALATLISPDVGYERAAKIAQKAYREDKTIREVLIEENILSPGEVEELLNPDNIA